MQYQCNTTPKAETAQEAPPPRKGGQWWPDDWYDATVLELLAYKKFAGKIIEAFNDWPKPTPPPDPRIVARLKRRGWLPSGQGGDPWRMWKRGGCLRCGLLLCVELHRPDMAYCPRCP